MKQNTFVEMAFKVSIIEDNRNFLESLQLYLEKEQKIAVVRTAGSIEEFMDLHHKESTDLVLLDVQLPGKSGIDAIPHIKKSLIMSIFARLLKMELTAICLKQNLFLKFINRYWRFYSMNVLQLARECSTP